MSTAEVAAAIDEAEEWRRCPGAEQIYEVSSLGRVRRCRNIARPWEPGKPYRLGTNTNGYPIVRFPAWCGGRAVTVHRLVALAFIGPPPSEKHEVNHINFVRNDNRASNLEWVTHRENIRHRMAGLPVPATREPAVETEAAS
jgi:hypothetical protein